MFEHSGLTAAVKSIKNTLAFSLQNDYGINEEDEAKVNTILKTHGLEKESFDFVANMEKIISNNLNDVSIDDNSNKNEKTMAGIHAEVAMSINKVVGYRYLYRKMVELYGKEKAKQLSGKMYDYSLALADSSKIMIPYCFSIDASKIVLFGRNFGTVKSGPAKRVSSYVAQLNEVIHQLSNHVAGALAIGTLFIDIAHVMIFGEKVPLEQLKEDIKTRKYVENCLQSFVHSVNHLSRNAVESPFTNISIFDRPKLATLLSEDDMGWYFNGTDIPYAIEYIIELQKIFLDFFDKGDPLAGGLQYRFPVTTVNISKKVNGETKILDKEFFDDICKREIYKYNIYSSEGTKVASCCRLINDTELMEMGSTVNSFGGTNISLGSHRVVTININRIALMAQSYDQFNDMLLEATKDAGLILKAHKELISELSNKGLQPFVKNGWLRLDRMFSTFGILGEIEAGETLNKKFGIKGDIVADILSKLSVDVRTVSKEIGIIGNIEQIPGESMAVRLAEIDRLLFGDDAVPYKLYANQFIPLWNDATLWERMDADGKYNKLLSGGSICHFNLGEKITSSQVKRIVEYAISSGCEHFALNVVYSECEDGHVVIGNVEKCPICDKPIKEKYCRIVGFLTPVSSWNKVRREWEFPHRSFKNVE